MKQTCANCEFCYTKAASEYPCNGCFRTNQFNQFGNSLHLDPWKLNWKVLPIPLEELQ